MAFKLERFDQHPWGTFVRPSVKLKHSPSTRAIIDMPYFPKQCICIAGYLNDADQFRKINHHRELLQRMLNRAAALALEPESKGQIAVIKNALLENSPNPDRGYATR